MSKDPHAKRFEIQRLIERSLDEIEQVPSVIFVEAARIAAAGKRWWEFWK